MQIWVRTLIWVYIYILSLICVLRINLSALYLTNMLKFDFYGASSLKMQQSRDRHVVPLGHISLILRRPVFLLLFTAVIWRFCDYGNIHIDTVIHSGISKLYSFSPLYPFFSWQFCLVFDVAWSVHGSHPN